ncbi:hypothetical protein F5Y19DRAFT_422185 [Xylariaceae sp. FL1651]|nr:hypothetical protein F5Y19DRAFT_422185 [Xylariaceae sp. FL1651]
MEFNNGMNPVYSPPSGVKPAANIVFVHGLFGDPWKTFATKTKNGGRTLAQTSKAVAGIFWPLHLLPHSIRNVKIFSFGYDASIERFMGATGLNTVHQHGRNLLNALCDLLDQNEPLPLLIVVHSLGGLVVKEALNQSAHTTDAKRSEVLRTTRGIVFLGTPHRGSSAATYGRVAFRLTQIFAFQNANIKLMSSLERGSEILDRISTAFIETLAKAEGLHVWSFAEEKPVRWGLVGMHIVPAESAKIGHERENWGTISGDHRQIARYQKATDDGFMKVTNVLKSWVADAISRDSIRVMDGYSDCLRSLDDPAARLRIQEVYQVSRAHKGSFEWLFTDQVPFTKWLSDDGASYEPIFWLTGKPGSGKSTLMRFALEDTRTEGLLPPSIGHPIAYFFHLRGKSLVQKSLQGMLKELLYQTLNQFPHFFEVLRPIYVDAMKASVHGTWDLTSLIDGFSQIPLITSKNSNHRSRLFLFIDALDENQDQKDNETLMRVLNDIVTKYKVRRVEPGAPLLKICLASRPWPFFQMALGGHPKIPSLAIDQFTTADIKAYTQSLLLQPLSETRYSEDYRHSVLNLSTLITSQAKGVYLWVKIVADSLHQHIIDGTPIKMLDEIVMAYPDELDELYEYTIRRIPSEYHFETKVAMEVVQRSRTQLTLQELYGICWVCVRVLNRLDLEEAIPVASVNWLASRCGGLIETSLDSPSNYSPQASAKVQFIHQTVQDFVRHGIKGLSSTPVSGFGNSWNGSHYLTLVCVGTGPPRSGLWRVYKDTFDYLRDVERDFDRDFDRSSADPLLRFRQISIPTLAAKSNGRPPQRLALFGDLWPIDYEYYLGNDQRVELQSLLGFDEPNGEDRSGKTPLFVDFIRDYLPILQNLYYFGDCCFKAGPHHQAFMAALGTRISTDRVDRPRMLSRVLRENSDANIHTPAFFSERPARWSVCKLMPEIPPGHSPTTLTTALACALPNEHIENETLLAMTEILLSAGASTSDPISIRSTATSQIFDMSLLNFVMRFKTDCRDDWVALLRLHGAELRTEELTSVNRIAMSMSFSNYKITIGGFEDGERDEEGGEMDLPLVVAGVMGAATAVSGLSVANACFDGSQGYQQLDRDYKRSGTRLLEIIEAEDAKPGRHHSILSRSQ